MILVFRYVFIKMSWNFVFLTNTKSALLWYFLTEYFFQQWKKYINFNLDEQQVKTPNSYHPNLANTERRSTIGGQMIVSR